MPDNKPHQIKPTPTPPPKKPSTPSPVKPPPEGSPFAQQSKTVDLANLILSDPMRPMFQGISDGEFNEAIRKFVEEGIPFEAQGGNAAYVGDIFNYVTTNNPQAKQLLTTVKGPEAADPAAGILAGLNNFAKLYKGDTLVDFLGKPAFLSWLNSQDKAALAAMVNQSADKLAVNRVIDPTRNIGFWSIISEYAEKGTIDPADLQTILQLQRTQNAINDNWDKKGGIDPQADVNRRYDLDSRVFNSLPPSIDKRLFSLSGMATQGEREQLGAESVLTYSRATDANALRVEFSKIYGDKVYNTKYAQFFRDVAYDNLKQVNQMEATLKQQGYTDYMVQDTMSKTTFDLPATAFINGLYDDPDRLSRISADEAAKLQTYLQSKNMGQSIIDQVLAGAYSAVAAGPFTQSLPSVQPGEQQPSPQGPSGAAAMQGAPQGTTLQTPSSGSIFGLSLGEALDRATVMKAMRNVLGTTMNDPAKRQAVEAAVTKVIQAAQSRLSEIASRRGVTGGLATDQAVMTEAYGVNFDDALWDAANAQGLIGGTQPVQGTGPGGQTTAADLGFEGATATPQTQGAPTATPTQPATPGATTPTQTQPAQKGLTLLDATQPDAIKAYLRQTYGALVDDPNLAATFEDAVRAIQSAAANQQNSMAVVGAGDLNVMMNTPFTVPTSITNSLQQATGAFKGAVGGQTTGQPASGPSLGALTTDANIMAWLRQQYGAMIDNPQFANTVTAAFNAIKTAVASQRQDLLDQGIPPDSLNYIAQGTILNLPPGWDRDLQKVRTAVGGGTGAPGQPGAPGQTGAATGGLNLWAAANDDAAVMAALSSLLGSAAADKDLAQTLAEVTARIKRLAEQQIAQLRSQGIPAEALQAAASGKPFTIPSYLLAGLYTQPGHIMGQLGSLKAAGYGAGDLDQILLPYLSSLTDISDFYNKLKVAGMSLSDFFSNALQAGNITDLNTAKPSQIIHALNVALGQQLGTNPALMNTGIVQLNVPWAKGEEPEMEPDLTIGGAVAQSNAAVMASRQTPGVIESRPSVLRRPRRKGTSL